MPDMCASMCISLFMDVFYMMAFFVTTDMCASMPSVGGLIVRKRS